MRPCFQAVGDDLLPFGFVLEHPKASGEVLAGTRQQDRPDRLPAQLRADTLPTRLDRPGDGQVEAFGRTSGAGSRLERRPGRSVRRDWPAGSPLKGCSRAVTVPSALAGVRLLLTR